jgi:hypothetical protein
MTFSHQISDNPYTFAFQMKGKTKTVLNYAVVKKHVNFEDLREIAVFRDLKGVALSDIKNWVKSLSCSCYIRPYGYNIEVPGDLYQLVYVNVPEGFHVKDCNEDIEYGLEKVSSMILGGNAPEKSELVNGIEGDIGGQYYKCQWVNEIPKDDLDFLLSG